MKTNEGRFFSKAMYSRHVFGEFNLDKTELHGYLTQYLAAYQGKETALLFDIGCGAGYWADYCALIGFTKERIICIDQAAGATFAAAQRGFRSVQCFGHQMPFADNLVDLAISIGVIHHAEDSLAMFSEMSRIVKPGGVLLVSVYNGCAPMGALMISNCWKMVWSNSP